MAKIKKYITDKEKNELLESDNTYQMVIKWLTNIAMRIDVKTKYTKKLTYNSIYNKYFDKNHLEEIIKGVLAHERSFYLNEEIENVKNKIGKHYKFWNFLNEIKSSLQKQNKYTEYSKIKARSEYFYLHTTADELLDIFDETAKYNKIKKIELANLILEVYVNVLDFYKNDDFNRYIQNQKFLDESTYNAACSFININALFEVYRDYYNMLNDTNELEVVLKNLYIYFYENIEKNIFWEKMIFNHDIRILQFKTIEYVIIEKYVKDNNKNINYRLLLHEHFHHFFDELNKKHHK